MSQPFAAAAAAVLVALSSPLAHAAEAAPKSPSGPAQGPAAAVSPVTVRPDTPPQGQVVASTAAAPMTSPDFTAEDAKSPPLAVGLGSNAALGRQAPPPSGAPGGLLKTNPDLPGGFRSDDVGVSVVF